MTYSVTYQDETGASRVASISENDYLEALENDYLDLQRRYNARYVTIQKIHAEPGEALHLVVTVNAPSHYLTSFKRQSAERMPGHERPYYLLPRLSAQICLCLLRTRSLFSQP